MSSSALNASFNKWKYFTVLETAAFHNYSPCGKTPLVLPSLFSHKRIAEWFYFNSSYASSGFVHKFSRLTLIRMNFRSIRDCIRTFFTSHPTAHLKPGHLRNLHLSKPSDESPGIHNPALNCITVTYTTCTTHCHIRETV